MDSSENCGPRLLRTGARCPCVTIIRGSPNWTTHAYGNIKSWREGIMLTECHGIFRYDNVDVFNDSNDNARARAPRFSSRHFP